MAAELEMREEAPDFAALGRRLVEEGRFADVKGNGKLEAELAEKLRVLWEAVSARRAAAEGMADGKAALDALSAEDGERAEILLEREGHAIRLGGVCRTAAVDGRTVQVALGKKDDGAELWLRHLLGCAAGVADETWALDVPAAPSESLKLRKFAPVDAAFAKESLQAIVDMAYEPFKPLIPFWPAVSTVLAQGNENDPPEAIAKRRLSAKEAWAGNAWRQKSGRPPAVWDTNRALWGDTPLDAHPQAEAVARAFWKGYSSPKEETLGQKPQKAKRGRK